MALRSPRDGLISVPNLKWTMPAACNSIHVLPPLFVACLTEYQAKSMTDSAIGRETAAATATDAPTVGRPYAFTLGIGFSLPFVCREILHGTCNRGDVWLAVDYPSPTMRLLSSVAREGVLVRLQTVRLDEWRPAFGAARLHCQLERSRTGCLR
jgi:hypothetical protein